MIFIFVIRYNSIYVVANKSTQNSILPLLCISILSHLSCCPTSSPPAPSRVTADYKLPKHFYKSIVSSIWNQIMSVRIQFDRPQVHFTNLDFLTGRVIVHLVADATISAITVKLEGESRTRLSGPRLTAYNNERSEKRRTELEWHKVNEWRSLLLRTAPSC
jgi:hypothetical protein